MLDAICGAPPSSPPPDRHLHYCSCMIQATCVFLMVRCTYKTLGLSMVNMTCVYPLLYSPSHPTSNGILFTVGKPRTLLAFAENRNVSACAPALGSKEGALQDRRPFEIGSMNLRRSTDGGKSWGPIQVQCCACCAWQCMAVYGCAWLLKLLLICFTRRRCNVNIEYAARYRHFTLGRLTFMLWLQMIRQGTPTSLSLLKD